MTPEHINQSRTLLCLMSKDDMEISVQLYTNGYRTSYEQVDGTVIEWLAMNGLIICTDIISKPFFQIELYKITELGKVVESFINLEDAWNKVEIDGFENFYKYGKVTYTILQKYNSEEVEPLSMLITDEEHSSYNQYYRQQIQDILHDRMSKQNKTPASNSPSLSYMFNTSVLLGQKDSDEIRTNNYVFKKCMEELGEMALEDQIENGLSYKDAGTDGVKGEAVDLAICAMDMFALQCSNMSAEEIEMEFLKYMEIKINKWRQIQLKDDYDRT